MRLRSYAADSGQRLAILPGSRPSNFRTVCCLATSHYMYIIIIHITYCASKLHLSRLGHTAYLHLYHAFIASALQAYLTIIPCSALQSFYTYYITITRLSQSTRYWLLDMRVDV